MTTTTTNTPDAEALRVAIDRQMLDMDAAIPCVVHAVSANGTTVDVVPAVSKSVRLDGERAPLTQRVIRGVPIALYGSTTLGLFVCPPIRPGDDGLLIACDRALDNWQYGEGVQMPPDMATPRHSDFTDALFYPGAQRASGGIAAFPTDAMTVQDRSGGTVASVKPGEISMIVGGASVIITGESISVSAGASSIVLNSSGIAQTGDTSINGNLDVSGVVGAAGYTGPGGGAATIDGDIGINGRVEINGELDVSGPVTVDGTIDATGDVTAPNIPSGPP